jgi:hypothetical protein
MSSISGTNAENPQSPEYGKGYKIENNGGCPCKVKIDQEAACKTVVQRFTRNDQSQDLIEEKECQQCGVPAEDTCPQPPTDTSCGTPGC